MKNKGIKISNRQNKDTRKGLRILDHKDGAISPELKDMVEELHDGQSYKWSILYLRGMGHLPEKSIPIFEDSIIDSKTGLLVTWKEIINLANQYEEIYDLIIIGSKNEALLLRYEQDQEMYEKCDMVIVMHDSCFWEIFSKDEKFIRRLVAKFKDIKYIESDFQND